MVDELRLLMAMPLYGRAHIADIWLAVSQRYDLSIHFVARENVQKIIEQLILSGCINPHKPADEAHMCPEFSLTAAGRRRKQLLCSDGPADRALAFEPMRKIA